MKRTTNKLHDYTFVWSPEGRALITVTTSSYRTAWAELKRQFPQHAKYKGEIYLDDTGRFCANQVVIY